MPPRPPPSLSHLRPTPLKSFLFGSAYYPEHWDAETRLGDIERMKAAGWNCIRLGEFSWDLFEPMEGKYDFSFYDPILLDLRGAGIEVILGTPTAAPPAWLSRKHPEILRWNEDHVPLAHGSRQHASHASPVFRDYCRRLTRAMVRHFQANPSVIGWQTDNEFHCHFSEDHSPSAQDGFRSFLREKYERIERLNAAWGNAFWALTYRAFDEIDTPRPDKPTHLNPTHVLDYRRFLSAAVSAFQDDQIEIIRKAKPAWFITHNGCFRHIDYRGPFSQPLDFLSYDAYPFFEADPGRRPESQAANLDYVRGYSGNFIVMEQQSGPGGQAGYFHDNPAPGEMRRMACSSIARGADGVLFFRWRTCRFGAEQYWCGILDHDNIPRRRYAEACQIGAEMGLLGPELIGTSVRVEVGIAGNDFDALEGHEPISHGLPDPRKTGEGVHGFFYRQGYAVGFVHPLDNLSGLGAYIVPNLGLFDPAWMPVLERFVEGGGILIVGARSGIKDRNGNVVSITPPGLLRPLVGATVEEYGRQNRPDLRPLALRIGKQRIETSLWYEALQLDPRTRALGKWTTGHLKGVPAITLCYRGKGAVLYVGTYFNDRLLTALLPKLKGLPGFPSPGKWHAPGLEIVERIGSGKALRFFINQSNRTIVLSGLPPGRAILSGRKSGKRVSLPANGVYVLGTEED